MTCRQQAKPMRYQYYIPLKDAKGIVKTVYPEGEPYQSDSNDRAAEFEAVKNLMEAKFGKLVD